MVSLARIYHTTVHLKPIQIYGRALFKIGRPRPRLDDVPSLRKTRGNFAPPIARNQSLFGPNSFRFLSKDGEVRSPSDWNGPNQEKLWLYNLHYFDDLTAVNATARAAWHRNLVDRWIAENPVTSGNGWEPYPVSLRIVNWIKWAFVGSQLKEFWIASLAIQSRWLEQQIEWHLLGNHLIANAKALIFSGLFFEGTEADRWLDKGVSILRTQVAEQILADGGHFELSPMYHAIILEDILDLINIDSIFPGMLTTEFVGTLRDIAQKMRAWLAVMTHPDGGLSFFNDAAFKIAPSASQLEEYAARLEIKPLAVHHSHTTFLETSGYVQIEKDEAVTLVDIAAIGPDYLPGHAHADTLSFEFSLDNTRFVVNGGTSCYGNGSQRQRERGTSAHSTVEIDGKNSSDVWAGFRVGRRARIVERSISEVPIVSVQACHNGYAHLPKHPLHYREWTFPERRLNIKDKVTDGKGRAVARFHIGPDVEVVMDQSSEAGPSSGTLRAGGRDIKWRTSLPAVIERSAWHPEFGVEIPIKCITVPFVDNQLDTEFMW